jgi:hypothetical protein
LLPCHWQGESTEARPRDRLAARERRASGRPRGLAGGGLLTQDGAVAQAALAAHGLVVDDCVGPQAKRLSSWKELLQDPLKTWSVQEAAHGIRPRRRVERGHGPEFAFLYGDHSLFPAGEPRTRRTDWDVRPV